MVARGAYTGKTIYQNVKKWATTGNSKHFIATFTILIIWVTATILEEKWDNKNITKGNHPPLISEETFRLVQILFLKIVRQ